MLDAYCPRVGGPIRKNWWSDRCKQRFAMAEAFPENECRDCGVYLRAWIDKEGLGL